jgi:hypothetical protein
MTEVQTPTPLQALILVRLLPAGEKGVKPAVLRKDLEPLLGHLWSGVVLTERLEQLVVELAALHMVRHLQVRSKKAIPALALTEEGRRAILSLLNVSQLPVKPKPSWASLKKSLLLAPALGIRRSSVALARDDNLRAFLLKQQYELPLDEFPTLKQAMTGWLRKALGVGEREKVTLETVKAALLRRESGEDRPLSSKRALDRLLAMRLGARRDDGKELREAILRRWIDQSQGKQITEPARSVVSRSTATPAAPSVDLPSFARKVQTIASACPTGRYGDSKIFIIHVWRSLQTDPELRGMDLETFKNRLAEANNERLLDLSRADMVQAMDPEDVRLSEVHYLNATFHFIRMDLSRRL